MKKGLGPARNMSTRQLFVMAAIMSNPKTSPFDLSCQLKDYAKEMTEIADACIEMEEKTREE